MRRHDGLLGGRGHGEATRRQTTLCERRLRKRKRCKRRLCEESIDEWLRAFYKERTFPPLCLTLITFAITRTTISIPLLGAEAYRYFVIILEFISLFILVYCRSPRCARRAVHTYVHCPHVTVEMPLVVYGNCDHKLKV